jgi:hypothetical protein
MNNKEFFDSGQFFGKFKERQTKDGEPILIPSTIMGLKNTIRFHITFHNSGEIHEKDSSGHTYKRFNCKETIDQIKRYLINSMIQTIRSLFIPKFNFIIQVGTFRQTILALKENEASPSLSDNSQEDKTK